ncbi:hypothetical protein PanWU01x14_242380 [Parasponia andersonii]|uniref:DUF1985 domain-containing protein n=1 Tax=Parasponia andersonii TaxID=3476 RepID=A0A2P5BG18_PARAD|nr:hypothetical protein PanWU01x14_242380 [Parasponia andersonii]
MHEFAMISGVNCGTFSSSHKVDMLKCKRRLKVAYFGDEKITIDELERIFIEMKYSKGKFKKKLNYINTNHERLRVDLIYYLKKDINKRALHYKGKVGEKKSKESYSLYGFPCVLQVWGYEAIPFISRTFAKRLDGNATLRCLLWKPKKEQEYSAIVDQCERNKKNVIIKSILHLSEFEESQDYIKGIASLNDESNYLIEPFVQKAKDPTSRTDPLEANIDDSSIKFDHCDYGDTGSYLTLPTQNNNVDCKEDDDVEVVSPHPRLV